MPEPSISPQVVTQLPHILPNNPIPPPKKSNRVFLCILLVILVLLSISLVLYFFVFNKFNFLSTNKSTSSNNFLKVTTQWRKECKSGSCTKEFTLNPDGTYEQLSVTGKKETGSVDKKLIDSFRNASADSYKEYQTQVKKNKELKSKQDEFAKDYEAQKSKIEALYNTLDTAQKSGDQTKVDGIQKQIDEIEKQYDSLFSVDKAGLAYEYLANSLSECNEAFSSFSKVTLLLPDGTKWEYGSCLELWSFTDAYQKSFTAIAEVVENNSLAKLIFLEPKDLPKGMQADTRPVKLESKDSKGVFIMNYYCTPISGKLDINSNTRADFTIRQESLLTTNEISASDNKVADVTIGKWKGYYSEVLTIDGDTVGYAKIIYETDDLRITLASGMTFKRSIVQKPVDPKIYEGQHICEIPTKDVLLRVAKSMVPRTSPIPTYSQTPQEYEKQAFLKGAALLQKITPQAVPANWKKETMTLLSGIKAVVPRPATFKQTDAFTQGFTAGNSKGYVFKQEGSSSDKVYTYTIDMSPSGEDKPDDWVQSYLGGATKETYFPIQIGSKEGWRLEREVVFSGFKDKPTETNISIDTIVKVGKETFRFALYYKKENWTEGQITDIRSTYETLIGGFEVVKARDAI